MPARFHGTSHVAARRLHGPSLVALVAITAACTDAPISAALEVTANQPPIAHLSIPDEVRAREPFVVDGTASSDLDGEIISYALTLDGVDVSGEGPRIPLVLDDDHEHEIALVVTDGDGATGRARRRVRASPAEDPDPPSIGPLTVTVFDDNMPLSDDASLLGGSEVTLAVTAEDASGVADMAISVSTGELQNLIVTSTAASRTATTRLLVPDIDGSMILTVTAEDTLGNASTVTFPRVILSASTDTDDDGVPDAIDPAPETPNGVVVEVYVLESIPRDLLGKQMAERVVETVTNGLAPIHTFQVPAALLSMTSADGTTTGLALIGDMPALEENWAMRIRGRLQAPAGLPMLTLVIGADDIGVIIVEGNAVASADDEYATNFFRTETLPPAVGPLFWGSAPVAYEIILANESGPFSFQAALTFEGPGTESVTNDELSLADFLLPE